MKTKIVKRSGYYRLEAQDQKFNDTYKSSEPILLGCISNFADMGQWAVSDIRLNNLIFPSPYLMTSLEELRARDEEELELVKSSIKHYRINKDDPMHISWSSNRYIDFDGADNPVKPEGYTLFIPQYACFTFKKAQEKLSAMKEYWDNFTESEITQEHLIHNPHIQPSSSHFTFLRIKKDHFNK